MSNNRAWLAVYAALAMAAVPGLVAAQSTATAQSSTSASDTSGGLEEITVTARRRSENISKVPVAITALDANSLTEQTVHTDADLQEAVPGLIVRTTAVSTQQNFSLRGQSIDSFTGSSPAVLGYVNDVEQNAGGPFTYFDIASIQVLKGPQGTLFGRNTTEIGRAHV